jgi:hypothetical protein
MAHFSVKFRVSARFVGFIKGSEGLRPYGREGGCHDQSPLMKGLRRKLTPIERFQSS